MLKRKEKNNIARERRKIHFTEEQLQIVLGGLMGDSSISTRINGSCRLKMCHGEKQKDYLEFKKKKLETFFLQESPTIDSSNSNNSKSFSFGSLNSYHYNSIVHQDFTDIKGLFYRNEKGKKRKYINMNILNKLDRLGMLIWYLDDGCFHHYPKKSSYIMYLSTCKYSLSEHETIKKWFWHKWKIESKIRFDNTNKCYYLHFLKKGMVSFNDLFLKPFKKEVPVCMHYKFPNF
jgi:hypothetical protein